MNTSYTYRHALAAVSLGAILLLAGSASAQQSEQAGSLSILDSLLQTRVTTVSKYSQSLEEAPAAVSVLNGDDIRNFGYRTLAEALSKELGFYLGNDRDYSYLGVRGFGRPSDYNNRILLLVDGHILNENVFGSAFLGTESGITLASIDRIEIVRGSLSSLYGTGALLASVNIITKKARVLNGAQVSVEAGSFGTVTGSAVGGKEFDNGVSLVATAQAGSSRGSDLFFPELNTPESNYGWSRGNDDDSYASGSIGLQYGEWQIGAFLSDRKKHVPTAYYLTVLGDPRTTTRDQRGYVNVVFDHDFGPALHWNVDGAFDSYYYHATYPYVDSVQEDLARGQWFSLESRIEWEITSRYRLQAGLQAADNTQATYNFWSGQTPYFSVDAPYRNVSVFVGGEVVISDAVTIEASLRKEAYSFMSTPLVPRGSIVIRPSRSSTFKILYGEAFRVPNTYERTYNAPEDYFVHNPSLRVESIRTLEIIASQKFSDRLFGSLSAFHYVMRDLIDQWTNPVDSMTTYINLDPVTSDGIGFDVNYLHESGARAFVRYTLQRTLNHDGAMLTNSPEHCLRLGAFAPLGVSMGISVDAGWESGRKTITGGETAPFFVTNATMTLHPWGDFCTLSIAAKNIFDASYAFPGGYEHSQSSIPQDRRAVYVRVSTAF